MSKRDWIQLLAFVCIIAVAIFSVRSADESTEDLRDGLISSCEVNGNPLRSAVRGILREGITDPHDPDLKEVFPNVPPTVIRRIVLESNRKKREALAKIETVDCVAQYR